MFTKLIKIFTGLINRNIASIMKALENIKKSLASTALPKSKGTLLLKVFTRVFGTFLLGKLLFPVLRYLLITIFGNNIFFSVFNMPLDNEFLWNIYESVKLYTLEHWYKFRQFISGAGLTPENRFLDKDIERVKALRNNINIINTTAVPKNEDSFLSSSLRKHYNSNDPNIPDSGFIANHK